ncbi:MAG: RNA polymerase sigma factor [Planctomycetota bacterium]
MALTTSAQIIIERATVDTPIEIPQEFWDLVECHRTELMNQALAVLGNIEDAEEVVQETFCEVFRNRERLPQMRSLSGWLRAINRANALNYLRTKRRHRQKLARKQIEAPDRVMTTGGFSALEMREEIAKAIESLPHDLRMAIILRYWEDCSYAEIAKRLNIPQGTVWQRLCDAGLLLANKLNVESLGAESKPHVNPGNKKLHDDKLGASPSL